MPKKDPEKVLRNSINAVAVVTCSKCGTMHLAEGQDYVVFYGNVSVGMNSFVIGNNIDQNGKLVRTTIFCRKEKCMAEVIGAISASVVKN